MRILPIQLGFKTCAYIYLGLRTEGVYVLSTLLRHLTMTNDLMPTTHSGKMVFIIIVS